MIGMRLAADIEYKENKAGLLFIVVLTKISRFAGIPRMSGIQEAELDPTTCT